MLIRELETVLDAAPDEVMDYALYVACPDPVPADNADEQTATIGCVDLSAESAEVRLYPPFGSKEIDGGQCLSLADLLATLREDAAFGPDLKLLAETPLIRDDEVSYENTFVPVVQVHIAPQAQEVWLLLAPPAEFPAGALPA